MGEEKALGQRLAEARRQAGLTQQELCQKAGLSYSTLAKIERGAIRSPSVFTVATIAEATSTSLEQLLDLKLASTAASTKKTSKTGVKFVYFDVNGTLVRFFERAFSEISKQSGKPLEMVETLFWRHDGPACRAEETPEQINKIFSEELGLPGFNWLDYYTENVELTPQAVDLINWASEHYEIGLLTNNWLGFTKALLEKGLLPKADYRAIVESAEVGCAKPDPQIYNIAQQKSGFAAKEILLIDDAQPYLSAADAEGWRAMWFDGFHPSDSIERIKTALEF